MDIPKAKTCYTVNDSIAGLYIEKYGVPVEVIRNVPSKRNMRLKSRGKS